MGSIRHRAVIREPGKFCAWPANGGMWTWGKELLFGFSYAGHLEKEKGHTFDPATSVQKFARSLDGGETWRIEDAFDQGITARSADHEVGVRAVEPMPIPGAFDFLHPDFAIKFSRSNNNDGPSHIYVTFDRGHRWQGPFALPLFGQPGILARTDVVVEDRHTLLAMIAASKANGREGRVGCIRTRDGGRSWDWVAWVDEEPEGYAIMPATVRLPNGDLLCVVRRKEQDRGWLAVYRSNDNAACWRRMPDLAEYTGSSGNPASVVALKDGRICAAYGVRSHDPEAPSRMCVRVTGDGGESWGPETVVRGQDGAGSDMGYPRMAQRPDGRLVLVYYYNHAFLERPSYRYIAATIFDPQRLVPE